MHLMYHIEEMQISIRQQSWMIRNDVVILLSHNLIQYAWFEGSRGMNSYHKDW